MPLQPLTAGQRAEALEKSRAARRARADLKAGLKSGGLTLAEVLASAGTSEIVAKTKVSALLESMPGVGKVRAAQIMGRLGIDAGRRVRGLGANQRAALEREFATAGA
jgi:lambda repressor-like predicted transcriptional regulator